MSRTRRFGALAAGLVVLVLLGGCGPSAAPSTSTLPSASGGAGTTSPSASPAAPLTQPAADPIAPPTVFSGDGNSVVPITKPAGATTVIATITGNAEAKNFDIRGLDGEQDRLVATTSPYQGSVLLDYKGGSTTQLRVHARGPWTITLSDPRSAPVLGPSYTGTGDTVLIYLGRGGNAVIEGGASGTKFMITLLTSSGVGAPVVKATAPYSGVVRWPGFTGLVVVSAVGDWSLGIH